MKRIAIWVAATLTVLVLVVGYQLSDTGADPAPSGESTSESTSESTPESTTEPKDEGTENTATAKPGEEAK